MYSKNLKLYGFYALENREEIALRYVRRTSDLGSPDMIILPGTKNTIGDLLWMRQSGLEAAILKAAGNGTVIFGICGGYQMLGESIRDPQKVESGGYVQGMGLLPVETIFTGEKTRTRVEGTFAKIGGTLRNLKGISFEGYEIHMGETKTAGRDGRKENAPVTGSVPEDGMTEITDIVTGRKGHDGLWKGNVYGTYVHGIFDKDETAAGIIGSLAEKKGIQIMRQKGMDFREFKETQYDILASGLREHIDMELVYRIMGL